MDYKNGKIYSIRSYQTNNIYIGSTTQQLSKRLSLHRSHYKRYLDGEYTYVTSFEILKYDDYYIELIEEYPCKNKMELYKKEGELIRHYDNAVNKVIPGQTQKEWKNVNKDKVKLYDQKYKENNKDIIKEYRENNKDNMKEYVNKNKDKIKERQKDYYNNNKDKMKLQSQIYRETKKMKLLNDDYINKMTKRKLLYEEQFNKINEMMKDFDINNMIFII